MTLTHFLELNIFTTTNKETVICLPREPLLSRGDTHLWARRDGHSLVYYRYV